MNSQAKSYVVIDGQMSKAFKCDVGVRQGVNLLPLLFAVYFNDFENFLSNHFKGLKFLVDDVCADILDKEVNGDLLYHYTHCCMQMIP